jgi:branched-chain amino acid transport system ATP-binding protein
VAGGVEIHALRPDRVAASGIVHVPQGDMLFPDMTVYENLLMGAYCVTDRAVVGARIKRVYALLPRLKERHAQVASSLSGGERRIVGIGRGLMAGGMSC